MKKKPKTYIPLVFYSNVEFLAKFLMNYLSIRLKAIIGECFASITSLIDECSTSDNSRLKQKCISTTYNVLHARHHP